jgi:hypothetical protein
VIEISQEEYHRLTEEARAWRSFVKRRLEEGFVQGDVELICVGDSADLIIRDTVIITPFGNATLHQYEDGERRLQLRQGDHVKLSHEVKLSIS